MQAFSNNILLSNLIIIRWLAITGQFIAILFVYFNLNIPIPIITCLVVVFLSAIINIYVYFTNNKNNHLSDKAAFFFLFFDTIQLGLLLYLTGGIYNPFSLLLIAPLIISASYLPIFFSICLLILSILIVVLISIFYVPINWQGIFNVPNYFVYGLSLSVIISLIFIFIYVYLFANSSRNISKALEETRVILAKHKQISSIGSLSSAAVHELSTPLNTIYLILNDLLLEQSIQNNSNIKKEINLLKSQADRCRKILLTMSKNPEDLKDNFFAKTTISDLIKTSFNKFDTKNIKLKINLKVKQKEELIFFKDEIVYSLNNIIQNAVQYAKSIVEVEIFFQDNEYSIIICDDGKGFKNEILQEIGKPYISKKEFGMGLGIFITKNLIESIQGAISFSNQKGYGARVEIKFKNVSS